MEVKKISWLLRALLALAGLACLWQLRMEVTNLRVYGSLLAAPWDGPLYTRAFVCSLFVSLAFLNLFPILAAAWGICRQAGLGRGFYQEKRLRLLSRLAAAETVLLAAADVMMLSFRLDRLGGGFLWGLPRMLDGTMLLYIGLTLGSAAFAAAACALGRSAKRAAALLDENAMTI